MHFTTPPQKRRREECETIVPKLSTADDNDEDQDCSIVEQGLIDFKQNLQPVATWKMGESVHICL